MIELNERQRYHVRGPGGYEQVCELVPSHLNIHGVGTFHVEIEGKENTGWSVGWRCRCHGLRYVIVSNEDESTDQFAARMNSYDPDFGGL